jgi:hypothetical protein
MNFWLIGTAMINVDLGDGKIIQMDEAELDGPHLAVFDNEHEHTEAIEYRLNDRIVHRSVHVHLKEGIGIEGILGSIS